MIRINFKDLAHQASAVPLDKGVVFRWPIAEAGVMMMASLGYPSKPPGVFRDVDLYSLQRAADAFDFFGYRGCDPDYHYFSMPAADRLRLPRPLLELQRIPIQLGLCLFVTFRDGRLTIPDPRAMSLIEPHTCRWALAW